MYKLLRSLVGTAKLDTESFDNLVKTLKDHYNPTPSFMVERYKFNCRVRSPEDSITHYVAALRTLAEHCKFGDTLEELLRDRLIFGINNDHIRQRLLAEPDPTYNKVLELATSLQAAAKGSKTIQNGDRPGHNTGTTTEGIHYSSTSRKAKNPGSTSSGAAGAKSSSDSGQSKPTCYRCGGAHLATTCKFKTAVCHFCKKRGHIASVCRTKQSQAVKRRNHHLDVSEDESESYSLYTVNGKSSEAMQVHLTMNSVPVSMELDTGAAISLINSATYHRIAQASQLNPLQKSQVTLKTYTGETINTLGWTTALVKCGEKEETFTHTRG